MCKNCTSLNQIRRCDLQHGKLKHVLELNFKQDELVKISPVGEVTGFDGRVFKINGEALIAVISQNDVHIPLDENHDFGEALGWFPKDSFELKEDGVYAKLELNTKGEELVGNKSYRYLSPVYEMGTGANVVGLDSVGLVNRPNLLNKELNNKEKEEAVTEEEFNALKNDMKEMKATIEALNKKPEESTAPTEANNKEIKEELAVVQGALKELNRKMTVFGKTNLEENDKTVTLSENDKKVADMLGIDHEEFAKNKEAN